VVFSGPWGLDAKRSSNLPGWLSHPGSLSSSAFNGVVFSVGFLSSGHLAISLGHDVLGLLLVERAIGLVVSQDGNISPRSRVPVGIIISLFGAFITISVSIVVLSGEDSSSSSSIKVALLFSVGNKETHVSFSVLAVLVVLVRLVHSVEQVSVGIKSSGRSGVIVNGIGGGTISNSDHRIIIGVGANVLDNHVAIHLGVSTATVLSGPFNSQLRALVVGHSGTNAVTSLGVVLGVEQSVTIVSVGIGFIQSVIGASWSVHVAITSHIGD